MKIEIEESRGEFVTAMMLAQLTDDQAAPPVLVEGLALDSRQVKPGYLFAGLSGVRDDGARHVPDAIARGARVILVDADVDVVVPSDVILLRRTNARRALALMAARFYGAQPDVCVAVTGTNGKSSVADMWRQLASLRGHKAASIGTLGIRVPDAVRDSGLTTPDCLRLQQSLAELADAGISHACLETSSHGLAQYRADGVRLAAGAFTNLSRDHLDYHKTLEAYLYAKMRLPGELLMPGAAMVVNADDAFAAEVEALAWARGLKVISIGMRGSQLALLLREPVARGQRLFLRWGRQEFRVDLPLIGAFQASNAMVAAALLIATGESPSQVLPLLARLKPVPGRLEWIGTNAKGAPVYVDYAHTPDGLRTVLADLRPHCAGRLHVVFGAGGDRDQGKRPEMGAVALAGADRIYVTDDNPRGEDPAAIRSQILAACPGAGEYADRAEAIAAAVDAAGAGDLVVIAGKGHETGQIIGDQTLPFNDGAVARACLAQAGAV
ncbi:MAG: UDP-N-acetylmuramoyl-L-alanyl-D-glutamate--2,6-diaminopimelate ligase [Sphingomonadales bacterium]